MVIQLIVNVEADDARIVAGLNGELQQDLKTLAADSLRLAFANRGPYRVQADIVALPAGLAVNGHQHELADLIAKKPLLTKADLTIHFQVTPRTIERKIANGSFPKPLHVRGGPRWRPEDITAFEHGKAA